jgi:ASC-1-like (ASCH) protein
MPSSISVKEHRIECAEPWFSLIREGKKTVEGRLNSPKYATIAIGDQLVFWSQSYGKEVSFIRQVTGRVEYPAGFSAMIEGEGLEKILPGYESVTDGVAVYNQYYSPELEAQRGAVAFQLGEVSST